MDSVRLRRLADLGSDISVRPRSDLVVARSDLRDALMSSGRGSAGGGLQSRLRAWLVSGQIALALVLLANAGLLFRSFVRLSSEKPGFDTADVRAMRFSLPQIGYGDRTAIVQFYDKLQSRGATIPAIKSSALISILPLAPKSISFIHFTRRTSRRRGAGRHAIDQLSGDYSRLFPNHGNSAAGRAILYRRR